MCRRAKIRSIWKRIAPDIEVDLTPADYDKNKDPQLDKAVEILDKK